MNDSPRGPQWRPPGTPVEKPVKVPRDYIGPALAAVATMVGPPKMGQESIVAAIIVAQALDRFGEKLIDAAAVSRSRS